MNIGIVTQNFYPRLGGMEYATYLLAKSLAERDDVSVAVACSTMPEVPKDFAYPFPAYRHRSFSILTPWLRMTNISRLVCEQSVNLLHGMTLTGGGREAMLTAKKRGLPCVVQAHGSDVQVVEEIGYGELRDPRQRLIAEETLNTVNAVVAVSSLNRDMIIDLGADSEKVTVIHNGCHYKEIGNIPFEDFRPQLDIDEDTFVLVTLGRNSPVKRMKLLFQALKVLKKSEYDILCLCIGPETNLRNLAQTYDVEEMVRIVGPLVPDPEKDNPPLPRLINLLRSADLFVSCSYVESFNSSALDALACGIPSLVTPKQGIVDFIEEGKTGYVIEEADYEYLAGKIEDLCRDRERLRSMSEEISNSVAHLDWPRVAERFAELYARVLQGAA